MGDEEYRNLIEWHRNTQKAIWRVEMLVGVIFFVTVVAPVLKYFGLWNLGGWW